MKKLNSCWTWWLCCEHLLKSAWKLHCNEWWAPNGCWDQMIAAYFEKRGTIPMNTPDLRVQAITWLTHSHRMEQERERGSVRARENRKKEYRSTFFKVDYWGFCVRLPSECSRMLLRPGYFQLYDQCFRKSEEMLSFVYVKHFLHLRN